MKLIVLHICIVLSIALLPECRVASSPLLSEQPRKFDEFGSVTCEDELARLDAFSVELQNTPDSEGYIIVYGGRLGRLHEAKARADRMKFYLVRNRALARKQIHTSDGGYRETLTIELWLRRSGEAAPIQTPTVKAKDVKFRGRVRVRAYLRAYYCGEGIG